MNAAGWFLILFGIALCIGLIVAMLAINKEHPRG